MKRLSKTDQAQSKIFITVGPTGDSGYITDGTADNVQIQAAIDAANAAGGGVVRLQPGTFYAASTINPKSNVTIQGAGMGSTVIQYSGAATTWCFKTLTTGTAKDSLFNIFLLDLTIANMTATHSALIRNCTNAGYSRVEAYHTDWNGGICETLVLEHCLNAHFYDNFIHDCTGNGVQVNACDYFHVRGNYITAFLLNTTHTGTRQMDDGIDIDEDFLSTNTVPSRYGVVEDNIVRSSQRIGVGGLR